MNEILMDFYDALIAEWRKGDAVTIGMHAYRYIFLTTAMDVLEQLMPECDGMMGKET